MKSSRGIMPLLKRPGSGSGMTLRELRYLVALANRAHFGRAAEDCHVSQPTLSTQIRKTRGISRDHLGGSRREIVRADRNGPGCGREGAADRRSSRCMLASRRTPHGPLTGPLNLGVIPTLAPYLLPRLLPLVKEHFKRLQTRGARGPHRAPPGATARLSDRCGVAGIAGGRRGFRRDCRCLTSRSGSPVPRNIHWPD